MYICRYKFIKNYLTMQRREQLFELLDQYISEQSYPNQPRELYDPIEYIMKGGGKRLRPVVLLMACDAYNDQKLESALPCATAIEIFHNFTLLHDDIMDNADIRRGKPTVYKKWGKNVAILSGDVMVIESYKSLEGVEPKLLPQILKAFSTMAAEVCEGQQFDMNFETRPDVSIKEYMNMIRLKTAVVFAAAAKMGGVIGGAGSESDLNALYNFGLEMGLAFQLQDDYLDTFGTEETLGKRVGGDIEEGKKTFLAIHAINSAGDATRRALLAAFDDENLPQEQRFERVKRIYHSLDIPAITQESINKHLENAASELAKLSLPEERLEPFRKLIEDLANRSR